MENMILLMDKLYNWLDKIFERILQKRESEYEREQRLNWESKIKEIQDDLTSKKS